MALNAQCPVCDAEISLPDDTVKDELFECEECGSELVVASVNPFEIEEAPEIEEDWGE
ncbi:MAG: lysine biosynthesis protein LysW [Calditrichae bacterium]|nr:lysine biosynthesis protein LysW [Calditrichia bacterium]